MRWRCADSQRATSDRPEMALYQHCYLQPVRDSNPCLHLERVKTQALGDASSTSRLLALSAIVRPERPERPGTCQGF